MAWNSFIRLLTLDNFTCPSCSDSPSIIVCDGLTLSYRKKYRLATETSVTSSEAPRLTGCSFTQLLLIPNHGFRQLILKCFGSEGISDEDITVLITGAEDHAPFLVPVLKYLKDIENVPKHWKMLIRDMAKSTSASGFAQCTAAALKQFFDYFFDFPHAVYDATLTSLSKLCPPLFTFFKHSNTDDRLQLKLFIGKLTEVLEYIESKPEHQLRPDSTSSGDSYGVFPSLPVIRERGCYTMDTKTKTDYKDPCRKLGKGHKTLLPGIFLVHCQHGVCYGFHVMDTHESPDTPFTIISTRFRKAPDAIVYDNSCNLHSYALNRNPAFFKDTRF